MGDKQTGDTILIVEDNLATLEVLERNLTGAGYQVYTATNVTDAITLLNERRVDLVITDLKMPGVSGMELIRYVRENLRNTEVMMITGYPTVESAVQAVKAGAE